jgi:carboxyl-terminal processing protease
MTKLFQEKKKASNDKLDTKIVGKEGTPIDLMQMDDEYLREGLFVLSDLITTKLG